MSNKFKERIKECRLNKKFSRKELALRLNVCERTISHWENGTRECDFDMLIKLSNLFEESIDFLLGKTD